jgi:peptidoglycan/xylan/chitin deacetylase (PgdA/CDA1 family)
VEIFIVIVSSIKQAIKRRFAWVNLPDAAKDTVLLTFDDGPHPQHTPTALRLLRRYNARAIFFVVGSRIERAPQLLKRIQDDGHLIGNHSYAHPLVKQLPFTPYLQDLRRCQNEVERLTGARPKFFRPPLGVFSAITMAAPRWLSLDPVLWSVNSFDLGPENEEELWIIRAIKLFFFFASLTIPICR